MINDTSVNSISDTNPETEEDPVESLATKLRASPEILQDIRDQSADPKYQVAVPQSDRASLQEAINKAQELYDKKTTRNDWLEVAQTLGQNLAKFAAASAGQRSDGRMDMSNVDTGKGIDYNARSDRAGKEYANQVTAARDLTQADRQSYQDKLAETDRAYNRNNSGLGAELSTAVKKEGEEFTASRDEQKDSRLRDQLIEQGNQKAASDANKDKIDQRRTTSSENKLQQTLQNNLDKEEMRQKQKDANEDKKTTRSSLADQLRANQAEMKSLDQQIKDTSAKVAAGQGLISDLIKDPDVGNKELDKVKGKYGTRAEKSGIDISAVQDYVAGDTVARKKPGAVRGFFGGKGDVDPVKGKEGIEGAAGLTDIKQSLDALKKRRAELSGQVADLSRGASVTTTTSSKQSTVTPSNTVQIQAPDGTIATVPAAQADKYIAKGGKLIK